MMDWTSIIAELGGGIGAVALAGLAYLYWSERQETRRLNDARFDDHKIMLETSKDMIRSVEKLTDTMAVLADRVERSGGK